MKKIYIACPYTGTFREQEYRFNIVTKYAGDLIKAGNIAFSPITHCHPIAKVAGLPGDYEFWREFSTAFIRWSEEGHILCLEGWQGSFGVQNEIGIMHSLNRPVSFVNPDGTIYEQATR